VRLVPERARRELARAPPERLEPRAAPEPRDPWEPLDGCERWAGCELRELERLRLCLFRFTDPDRDDPDRLILDLLPDLRPPRR
jgi:hypothetical protein